MYLYCSLTEKNTLSIFFDWQNANRQEYFSSLDKFNDKSTIPQISYSNPLCLQIDGWYLEFVLCNKMKYEK